MANEKSPGIILEHDTIKTIRQALLVGLAAYGEIERLENAREVLELAKREVPAELRVTHPTGNSDTVSEFAEALRALEYADEAQP